MKLLSGQVATSTGEREKNKLKKGEINPFATGAFYYFATGFKKQKFVPIQIGKMLRLKKANFTVKFYW